MLGGTVKCRPKYAPISFLPLQGLNLDVYPGCPSEENYFFSQILILEQFQDFFHFPANMHKKYLQNCELKFKV